MLSLRNEFFYFESKIRVTKHTQAIYDVCNNMLRRNNDKSVSSLRSHVSSIINSTELMSTTKTMDPSAKKLFSFNSRETETVVDPSFYVIMTISQLYDVSFLLFYQPNLGVSNSMKIENHCYIQSKTETTEPFGYIFRFSG